MVKKFRSVFSTLLAFTLGAGCVIFPANVSATASTVGGHYAADGAAQPTQLYQADPTIFADNNTYYLYGTNEADASQGIKVFTSTDLIHWVSPDGNTDRYALKKGDSFGTSGFWAPQVFLYKGTYYMAYVANEQIAIATSSSPLGPFKQTSLHALMPNYAYKNIDPYVFFDTDGQIYLYYVEENGGNNLCAAKMKSDLSGIVDSTKTACIHATLSWENTTGGYPVTEGPTVIKEKNTYFFFYSANDYRNPDYAVGYATSSSPLGPWTKQSSPFISRNVLHENGTGHGDIFTGPNNQMYYVLHTHNSSSQPKPRKTALVKIAYVPQSSGTGTFSVDASSFYYLQQYPNDPVQNTIDAITALPNADAVTLNDEAAVNAAEKLYDALTDAQKSQVTNADKLKDLQTKISTLKDKAAAQKVIDAINALPDTGNLKLSDENAVSAAQSLYDSLTDAQKSLVTNVNVLTADEKQIAALQSSGNSSSQAPQSSQASQAGSQTSTGNSSTASGSTSGNSTAGTSSGTNPGTGGNGIIPAIALLASTLGSAIVIKSKTKK